MKKIITSILIILSCISTRFSSADTGQKDKGKSVEKLEKIMIIFVGKKYENRRLLEGEMTYYINDRGFNAEPCVRYFTDTELPEKEEIIPILEENGFDGILVVQVLDLDVKEEWQNAKLKYGNSPTATPFFNYYELSLQYIPGYSTQKFKYELVSTLFRTYDKEQVFTTVSTVYEQESLDLAMESFAQHLANQLKKSKTLAKTK
jgi:hypothetical protein